MEWVPRAIRIRRTGVRTGTIWNGLWRCLCDCGEEVLKPTRALNNGCAKSCGCLLIPKTEDLSGKRFGKLVVVARKHYPERSQSIRRSGSRRWVCRCDCGREVITNTHKLLSGRKRNCECEPRVPDPTNRLRRLKEFREQYRIDTYNKFCERLQSHQMQVLTTLDQYLAEPNSTQLRIQTRCHAGHELGACWSNFVHDPDCRECRRLSKLGKTVERKKIRRFEAQNVRKEKAKRIAKARQIEWLREQDIIRYLQESPDGLVVLSNPPKPPPALPKIIRSEDDPCR